MSTFLSKNLCSQPARRLRLRHPEQSFSGGRDVAGLLYRHGPLGYVCHPAGHQLLRHPGPGSICAVFGYSIEPQRRLRDHGLHRHRRNHERTGDLATAFVAGLAQRAGGIVAGVAAEPGRNSCDRWRHPAAGSGQLPGGGADAPTAWLLSKARNEMSRM